MSFVFCGGMVLKKWDRRVVIRNGDMLTGRQVIVADHGSKPIPIGTLKSIIDGAKLSVDDFR